MRDNATLAFAIAEPLSMSFVSLKQLKPMVSRNNRDSKAVATHVAAMKIVETERAQGRLKTDRLKALRLARQAEIEAPEAAVPKEKR